MQHNVTRAALPLQRLAPRALYVHLPFCARQCPYCDFPTARLDRGLEDRYLEALGSELARRAPQGFAPRTVFLGGGTPAELTTPGIERLVALLGPLCRAAREVTLEANPRTLLPRKLAALRSGLGVTRVSLGAQSFSPPLLERLGRFHRPEDVVRAVATAREVGVEQVSLDLIFAVPGQGAADLQADLAAALALRPDHVSLYCLTIEPGTAYAAAQAQGTLRPQPPGREARLFAQARRTLRAAGFEHYEVSNFARPGRRCAHNQVYWRNHPYLGVGNGAASHLSGERRTNLRDPAAYAACVEAGRDPAAERERLTPERKLRETAYLALRTSPGIVRRRFLRDCGVDPWAALGPELTRLEGLGLVRRDARRAWLTGRGVTLADAVGVEVL